MKKLIYFLIFMGIAWISTNVSADSLCVYNNTNEDLTLSLQYYQHDVEKVGTINQFFLIQANSNLQPLKDREVYLGEIDYQKISIIDGESEDKEICSSPQKLRELNKVIIKGATYSYVKINLTILANYTCKWHLENCRDATEKCQCK